MCKVKGVRVHCACKDERCTGRYEFKDWTDRQDNFKYSKGHGWETYDTKIITLCQTGSVMITHGLMEWKDKKKNNEVVKMIPHCGMDVDWEYRTANEQGQAILCDHCNRQKHKVSKK